MKKKPSTKRVTDFLESVDWMFELNNFERMISVKGIQPDEQKNLTAEIFIDTVYKTLTINLYPIFFDLSLDLQRKALLHELVHTILEDGKRISTDLLSGHLHILEEIRTINEKATTSITHLLDCLLRKHLSYARKSYKDYLKK